MSGAIARHPDHPLAHAEQGPTLTGALWQLDVDEEIRELHLMPIHPERFEAISVLADAQLQCLGNPLGIHPRLKGIMIGTRLFQRQGGDIPAFSVELPATR